MIPYTTSGSISDKWGMKTTPNTTTKNGVKTISPEPKECWATGKPINIPQTI
jgi:hypothetical protein